MSATLYDTAILKKLKKWTEKSDIRIYGPSEANRVFQINADIKDDKPIKLPIIVLSRNGFELNNTNRMPINFDGKRLYADIDKVKQINAIPITLNYDLDVYTRYYEEADAYIRELIFNIINFPKVTIKVPYLDFNYDHISNIRLSSNSVTDNSMGIRNYKDTICNLKLSLNIDDAYLWDSRIKTTVSFASDGLNVDTVSTLHNTIDSEPVNVY